MADLFEDTESEPYHFIVLDSQDTENVPLSPSWDDTSILRSLPALRIPETQYELDLTTIPDSQLSPIHSFHVSETILYDSELVDSCGFNPVELRKNKMDDRHIGVIDETSSHGSSTSESSGHFGRSLSQSMIENPKFDDNPKFLPSSKGSDKKVLNMEHCKGSSDTKMSKEVPSTSCPQKMSKDPNVTVLARQSLFKNYEEDTESDEKEVHPIVCTPSTLIGSLQFSQESIFVPDTADEMNYIEPSPEHNPTPTIIPDSPTLSLSEESDDDTQDPTMIEASILKQKKTPETLDTTIEHVEDSIKESQNFQLLYMDTQASQISEVVKSGSSEKSPPVETSKKETEHSHHDNSGIISEGEDFNLHLSLNTQNESFKEATSQRSNLSGKMSISQSPATPKDNSNEEVKFQLIIPSSVQSVFTGSKDEFSKIDYEENFASSHKPNLVEMVASSQQEISQRISSGVYKGKSQENVIDLKNVQSQEVDDSKMKESQKMDSPDVLPDSQEKVSTILFTKFHKVKSKDIESSSETRNSSVRSEKWCSQQEDSHVESQKREPSSQKEDSIVEFQKRFSQKCVPSSQKEDSNVESQKVYSQMKVLNSQKENSNGESQTSYSPKRVSCSQKKDSKFVSETVYSQKGVPISQKEDSHVDSQRNVPSSQKEDFHLCLQTGSQKAIYHVESQKGHSQKDGSSVELKNEYSQKREPSSQKEDSQEDNSQKISPSSQKEHSSVDSQKEHSPNVASTSQKGDISNEPLKVSSQKMFLCSQKEDSYVESQKRNFRNVTPSSQKVNSQNSVSNSPKSSQKDYLQDKNSNSQSRNTTDKSGDSQKKSSQNTPTSSKQGHSHCVTPASQEQENPVAISGNSQRENSQDFSTNSKKKNTQDMSEHLQNKDSQEMMPLLQREQIEEEKSRNSQNESLSSFAQRELSQTASQARNSQGVMPPSQKEESANHSKLCQKGNSQDSLLESQRDDLSEMVTNLSDVSVEYQKENSESSIPAKKDSQDLPCSLPKGSPSLSEKEKSLGKNSEKEDFQYTLPDSQKDATCSQVKNSNLQAESQSQILPHGFCKEKTLDLSVSSQNRKSQSTMPTVLKDTEIPAISKADSQSRISTMNPLNVPVTEIRAASPNKNKKSIKSTSQIISHSQPSEPKVSGSYDSKLCDMKQSSYSQDSGLPHLTNLKQLAHSSGKSDNILERRLSTDRTTQDPSNNLPISKKLTSSVDIQNTGINSEELIAIPLGPVTAFQKTGSLPKQQDSLNEPVMFLSQERNLHVKKEEAVSTSQPPLSTLKRKYPEGVYQLKPGISKNVSEETLPFSSPANLESQEELKSSEHQELSPLKDLSHNCQTQEFGNDSLKDKDVSEKTASPEKMEVDFTSIQLPSKPNVCYLKESQHSQGSSTITLSQNHQFEIYTSQAEASGKVSNSKEVPAVHNKDIASNPDFECSKMITTAAKSLTKIKPKDRRRILEISEASSTMYPSQTSTSQQRQTSVQAVQPQQHTATSSVARYNVIDSRKPKSKTEPPPPSVAGPSNDPYLFISSQPKIIQTVESKKKQRRSKVFSKFSQKRTQKKTIGKKKSTLSGHSWTIRKDYKSPVHRLRFEPQRKRSSSLKLLKDDPIFLKVPAYKDIETLFTKKDSQKEQVKSSCSSDSCTQPSNNKTFQKQQALFTNLQNVLQRKIVEETVVQLVYRKTTIETVKNSKVVDSRTIVEKEQPVIIRSSRNEDFKYLNSTKGVSPFCSPSSLTSGEYADVSSLSHSDSKNSNSSSFGSLTTKQSRFEMPMSPLVQYTDNQAKKCNPSGPQIGQSVIQKQLQSPGTDDDLMKAPSPITSIYKDAHSVYCSTDELHTVNQSCENGRPYVTETAPHLQASSNDPAKLKPAVVQNSDSLFSSTENLNISDSGPPATMAEQGTVVEKEGQSSVDSLVAEAEQSITLHVESAETSEIDLRTPPLSQKRSSSQKRKVSHFEENSEETGPDELPPQKRLRKDSEDGNGLEQTKTSEECGSPEISPQNFKQQINMPPLSLESSQQKKTGIGIKVMAKWKDGYFYPGTTASLEKGGKCSIHFADGDQLWVKINQILIANYLPQGQSVMVQSTDSFFDSGMIVDHIENSSDSVDSFAYRIEMDDNTTVDCTRQQVILTEDQAAILLSDEEYQMGSTVASTPQPTGADVSLDNLVDGCRRSANKGSEVSSEKMESRSGKRTRLMKMEPQAMSTPTPKRKAKTFKKGFMAHLNLVSTSESWSSDKELKLCNSKYGENLIGAAVSSPKSRKYDKSRHVKKELFDTIKGPIPAQKNLFKGMNFLLTHTEKNAEQKLMEKKMIQDHSSESSTTVYNSDADEPGVPFDKHHLQAQIEAGGGTVFESWSDKFITKKTKSFIISSSYQRTIKYLQGLAAGIPCVSHLWIRDCCQQGALSEYKSYMLQAGISLKKRCLLECKLKPRFLNDTQVLVFSTDPDFVSTWSEILVLAGCNVVKKFKKTRDQYRDVEFVITDKTCSAHIKKQAEIYNSPLLSTEWVIQCLIHGQKLCYTGHEKFDYDYEEEK